MSSQYHLNDLVVNSHTYNRVVSKFSDAAPYC